MNKWIVLLLFLTGCVGSTTVDSKRSLATATSFAQPLVVQSPTSPVSIVNWEDFQWTESDTNWAYFNLYYSTISPHVYDNVITGITNFDCVLSNMVPGTTYYMGATAVSSDGTESDLSDQYVFLMPTTLEFGVSFDQSVTNVSVQSSTNLMTWQASNARPRTNGLWRVDVDSSIPVEFFRGIGQVVPAL